MTRASVGVVTVLAMLLGTPANATIQWFYGMDDCNPPLLATTGTTGLWSTSITGTPTLVTTGLDGDPGNRCAYNLAPASAANVYLPKSFTSDASLFAGMHIKFTSCPTTRRRILTFRSTNEPKFGAMVTVERAPGSTTSCILKAFYESSDVTPGECSASATMDQTECGGACTGSDISTCVVYGTPQRGDIACSSSRCVNECDAANVDIGSTCAPGIYGQVTVPTGSWRNLSLAQENGTGATAGSVIVSLYEGVTAGANAVQRGSTTRKQGKCASGTGAAHTNGRACNVDGDCGGVSAVCNVADVVTIEEVRFGTDDSVAAALDYTIDALWTDNGSALANWRVESLAPIGQEQTDAETNWEDIGSAHSCGSGTEWQCLNDPASPDDALSALDIGTDARPTIGLQFATPVPTNPVPTPVAVGAAIIGEDASNAGASTIDLEWYATTAYTTAITAAYTPYDLENNPGGGLTTDPYYTLPALVAVFAPNASPSTPWDATAIANMRLKLHKTAGAGNNARMTQVVASVLSRMPNPPVPTVIPDRNRNGTKTVVYADDSRGNQAALHNTLAAGLLEPTNLVECAMDGGALGDIARDISVAGAINDIIETSNATSGWGCNAIKGATGDTADIVLVAGWANNQQIMSYFADPSMDTPHEGEGVGEGYCDDNGGAQQGGKCNCPMHSGATLLPLGAQTQYCRVRGTNWNASFNALVNALSGSPHGLYDALGCTCNTNADCKLTTGAPDGVCAAVATPTAPAATRTPGNPTPKVCVTPAPLSLNSRVSDDPPNAWYTFACQNAPGCAAGLCIATTNEAYIEQQRAIIQAAVAARPTNTGTLTTPTPPSVTPAPSPKPPVLVWVLPYSPLQNFRVGVDGASAFPPAEQKVGKARDELKARAEAVSLPWVDVGACMLRDCPDKRFAAFDPGSTLLGENTDGVDGTQLYCLKDSIHPSNYGDAFQGQCLINCLTNAQGTSDGICGPSPTAPLPTPPGRRCTQGKINDACAADAECSTYHCDFGAVP